MEGVVFLKAGMHAGNTCLTKIYNCSPSCLCRLQNWVMLFTGAYLGGGAKAVLFFIYLFTKMHYREQKPVVS